MIECLAEVAGDLSSAGVELHLETDLGPADFAALLDRVEDPLVRANYDSGNSASLGYDPREEFAAYGDRIGSVHVKDRVRGGGTVALGTGDADIPLVLRLLAARGWERPLVLQAARGDDGSEARHGRRAVALAARAVGPGRGGSVDLELTGKRVVVGGGSRGIGLAIARGFLAEGARVALIARGADGLAAAREELGADVVTVAADLSSADGASAAVADAAEQLGGLDVAVANAGQGGGPLDWDVDAEVWEGLIDQNLRSPVFFCQAAGRAMDGGGAIAVIGSIAGLEDLGAPLPYAAAKAGLTRYARDLGRRLAPRGIRVNMVAPGNVLFEGGSWAAHLERDRERVEAMLREDVPMQRFGTPEEIADAVLFLCSARASFVTGACLVADGGQTRA